MKMKQFKLLICLFLILKQSVSLADSAQAAVGTAVAAGAIFGLVTAGDAAITPNELEIFIDPQTQTTTQINEFNSILIESKLVDIVPGVFLILAFKNNSDKNITVEANKIKFIFSSGLERLPDQDVTNQFQLPAKQNAHIIIKMTKKADFNNQDSLKIQIPIIQNDKNYFADITYLKNPNYVDKSFHDNSIFEVGFEYGPSFFSDKTNEQNQKKSSSIFGLDLNLFWSSHSGIKLGFKSVDYELDDSLKSQLTSSNSSLDSRLGIANLGYIYRLNLNEKHSLQGSAMLSQINLTYRQSGEILSEATKSTLGLKLEGDYLLSKIDRGPWLGNYTFYYGIDYYHLNSFQNKIGNLSGGVGSIFIGFKIGM